MKRLRVLIVDDEPMNLEVAQAILEGEGYEVACAHNGEEALEAAADPKLDLVLMDISMPVLDGITATRRLRENVATRDLPVIFVTGSTSGTDKSEALKAGANAFMLKPYKRQQLVDAISEVMGASEPRPSGSTGICKALPAAVHDCPASRVPGPKSESRPGTWDAGLKSPSDDHPCRCWSNACGPMTARRPAAGAASGRSGGRRPWGCPRSRAWPQRPP
jgi:CheY-like chemotaxis protein